MPQELREWLPQGRLACHVSDAVGRLALSAIHVVSG